VHTAECVSTATVLVFDDVIEADLGGARPYEPPNRGAVKHRDVGIAERVERVKTHRLRNPGEDDQCGLGVVQRLDHGVDVAADQRMLRSNVVELSFDEIAAEAGW
jgi:hypothetical protein